MEPEIEITDTQTAKNAWVLHHWLSSEDATHVDASELGLQCTASLIGYRLCSNTAISCARGPTDILRRTLVFVLDRALECLTDAEIERINRTRINFGFAWHDAEGHWDINTSPTVRTHMPLLRALCSPLDHDSELRWLAAQQTVYSENRAFELFAQQNSHASFEIDCWNHPLQVQNVNVRRSDPGFLERRLRSAEQLFERMLQQTKEGSQAQMAQMQAAVEKNYAKYREPLEQQHSDYQKARAAALDAGKTLADEDFPQEPPPIPSLENVKQHIITTFIRRLMEQWGDLEPEDPRNELVKEAKLLWTPQHGDAPEAEAGVHRTITYPMGFVEIDLTHCPPRARYDAEIGGREPHSLPITRRHFPGEWLKLRVGTALETDFALHRLLQNMSLVNEDSKTGEKFAGNAAREFVGRMRPVVAPGAGRLFWLEDKEQRLSPEELEFQPHEERVMQMHHLCLSYYVFPEDPTAPTSKELRMHFELDHLITGRGSGCITLPWRQLAQEAGTADQQDGLDVCMDSLKTRGYRSVRRQPVRAPMTMATGEEWTVEAIGVPLLFPLPIVVQSMLKRDRVGDELLQQTLDGTEQKAEPEAEAGSELTQMVVFNGLYVCITMYPNVHMSRAPMYADPALLQAALGSHHKFRCTSEFIGDDQ